jgi:hypothetical protein
LRLISVTGGTLVDQCSVLYIAPGAQGDAHIDALRTLGFSVDVVGDLPTAQVLSAYHAVVVRVAWQVHLPGLGARLRVKPHFGRRVLVALVSDVTTERQRREATASGFDVALPESCTARDLAAHILRRLRPMPEYRCLLRGPIRRRSAA